MTPTDTREPLKDGVTKVTSGRTGKISYEARWSWMNGAGKRQQGRETFASLKAARSHRARMVAAIAESRYEAPTRLTVADYATTWLTRRERDWSTSTAYTRRHQWQNHIEPRLGSLPLQRVTRHHCQQMVDELSVLYKPAMIRNLMAMVTAMFGAATRDGLITRNPAERLDLPAIRNDPQPHWTPEQVRRFLEATVDHRDHALYVVLLSTGMRIGEAIALRWIHLDLERSIMTVTDTLRRGDAGNREPGSGTKTTKARTVALTPECGRVLTTHREAQLEQRRQSRAWDIRGFVFTGRNGTFLDYPAFARRLKDVQAPLSDLPTLTAHGFRHSVSTILMQGEIDPVTRAAMLGHSIQMTMATYSHHSLADLQGASAALGAKLRDDNITHDSASKNG